MKFISPNLLLYICLSISTFSAAQVITGPDQDYSKFLIDPNRPYAYLELDHVGPRKQLRDDEPSEGIWLRFKNNCKLPIVVLVIGNQSQDAKGTLILEDEVVLDAQVSGGGEDARMAGIFAPRELQNAQNLMDIFRWRNKTEEEIRTAEAEAKNPANRQKRPRGYNFYNGFDNLGLTLITPGSQVVFSVPANHVGKTWHIEIPFRLAVPNKSKIRPPYSYLAFYQEDLERAQKASEPTTR